MTPAQALELGARTASAGFFFDALELIAACSPQVGGIDALRGAIEVIFPERDRTNDDMAHVAALLTAAFGRRWDAPRAVDDYRVLLRDGVFEVVNRWSYIRDIAEVNRLQAWFYAGFGVGRARTALLGLRLFERLRDLVPSPSPADQAPENLHRLAVEAAKQMAVPAEEHELARVAPLLGDLVQRTQSAALVLLRERSEIAWSPALDETLQLCDEVLERMRREVGARAPGSR